MEVLIGEVDVDRGEVQLSSQGDGSDDVPGQDAGVLDSTVGFYELTVGNKGGLRVYLNVAIHLLIDVCLSLLTLPQLRLVNLAGSGSLRNFRYHIRALFGHFLAIVNAVDFYALLARVKSFLGLIR